MNVLEKIRRLGDRQFKRRWEPLSESVKVGELRRRLENLQQDPNAPPEVIQRVEKELQEAMAALDEAAIEFTFVRLPAKEYPNIAKQFEATQTRLARSETVRENIRESLRIIVDADGQMTEEELKEALIQRILDTEGLGPDYLDIPEDSPRELVEMAVERIRDEMERIRDYVSSELYTDLWGCLNDIVAEAQSLNWEEHLSFPIFLTEQEKREIDNLDDLEETQQAEFTRIRRERLEKAIRRHVKIEKNRRQEEVEKRRKELEGKTLRELENFLVNREHLAQAFTHAEYYLRNILLCHEVFVEEQGKLIRPFKDPETLEDECGPELYAWLQERFLELHPQGLEQIVQSHFFRPALARLPKRRRAR